MFENLEVRTVKTVTIDVTETVEAVKNLFKNLPENTTEIFVPVCDETRNAFRGTKTRELLKETGIYVRKSGQEFRVVLENFSETVVEEIPKKNEKKT